jgi:hypothetical protein
MHPMTPAELAEYLLATQRRSPHAPVPSQEREAMLTPRVNEVPIGRERQTRDDFSDEFEVRAPRRPPYRRATQRELVRAAVMFELHPDVNPKRKVRS